MKEIWKDIEGYEGLYQVSNCGKVKSLNYRNCGYSKDLVPKRNNSGYLWVELFKNGKRAPMLIHRLVANAFIPNPDKLPQVNHKDENPENNCIDNLEWCTSYYNVQYTFKRHPEKFGKKQGAYGPYKHKNSVVQMTKLGETVKSWLNAATIERETLWKASSIISCCEGKRKSAYGFIWQYAS